MIGVENMQQFPKFMKSAANRIAPAAQHTPGVEGYVFDGVDGTQIAFWECHADANTEEHIHEFDEYFVVVEGCYTVTMDGKMVQVNAGQECVIPRGTRISGSVVAGTRTIHMFGGRRAARNAGG
jgi:mannose-6-phosphate isomerase-like protein (cupin superfamily)